MVLMNASKNSRNVSSIINRSTGGGNKKAGQPPVIGLSSWSVIAYNQRGLPLPLSNLRNNRFTRFPSMNLPQGFRPPIHMR